MIIPADFAQANLRFTGVGVPNGAEITLGLDLGSFAAGSPDAVADAVADAFSPNCMSEISFEVTFVECLVKFGPNDTGPTGSVPRAVVGGNAASCVPPNTSLLVRKSTALGGRRGRGRIYMPGVPEAYVSGSGDLTTAMLNTYTTQWAEFLADLITAGLVPVVLHSPGNTTTPAPTEISSFLVERRMATQRDRMRR